jgi:NAD(P)-dependent dehydrogenase (short-subunit alcohol dehydrogenase family)
MSEPLVVLVTGASSGFGYETVRLLANAGHRVFGTMRDVAGKDAESARNLATSGVTSLDLDITVQESVDGCAAQVLNAAGRVDVLINNAGASFMGTTEAFTPEAFDRQLAIGVIGPFRVSRAFLPYMRANRSGLLVFLSSMVGRFVLPFMGPYLTSKWAIEGLAESFSYELRPFGVDVSIIEPGSFSTNIASSRTGPDDLERLASYGDVGKTIERIGAVLASTAGKPIEVARAIAALVAMPAGTRPLRTVVPAGLPAEAINEAVAPIERAALESYGLGTFLAQAPAAV